MGPSSFSTEFKLLYSKTCIASGTHGAGRLHAKICVGLPNSRKCPTHSTITGISMKDVLYRGISVNCSLNFSLHSSASP